jgi:(1->4)-alpha-D-glucan 1-alpha-D-glucosylmutase
MLSELENGMSVEQIVEKMESGLPKLWVTHTALCLRREHPDWFGAEASYRPVIAEGSKSDHVVGYLRGDSLAVFVPRWPLKLGGNWGSTTADLPEGTWKNKLTGERSGGRVRAQALFKRFPVALLVREAE